MKIVVIGAAPTALGVAYRLNELKKTHPDQAGNVELLVLEQVTFFCTRTEVKSSFWTTRIGCFGSITNQTLKVE